MPKNKKPRKKKYAFKAVKRQNGNSKKILEQFQIQITQLYQQGKTQEALTLTQQALTHFPDDINLLANAGGFAGMLGQLELAKKYMFNSLKLNPNDVNTHNNLGNIFKEQKQFDQAKEYYQTALKLNPNYAQAHNNLASLLADKKQFAEAKTHYQIALKLNPNHASAHNNLGNLFKEQKQFDQAKEHYQIALKLNPNYVDVHYNLAILFKQQKQFNKCKEYYQITLKLNPNHINARYNLSLLQLTLSNFNQGWQGYEYRYHPQRQDRNSIPPNTTIPQYQGKDLNGKNIVIYPEQGLGDGIQFVRYLPLLKSQKGVSSITLICKFPLKKLFSSMDCIDNLVDTDEFNGVENIQGADYWVFIMSLPLHFNTTLETIPNHLPYLASSKENQNQWQDKLPKDFNNSFNIGLVWKGSKIHKNDASRSLPSIKTLKPLWQLQDKISKNLNFISLQKGEDEDEAQNPPTDQPIIHLGTEIQDFADSAAIVSQLDLVISVDTAIVHLAGSLNIPCWVLLPYDTEWRWLVDRDDSPWYPNSMRLFRQTNDDDWDEVIERVVEALAEG